MTRFGRGNRAVEVSVETDPRNHSFFVRGPVKNIPRGLPWLLGEVDLIAVERARARMWVIEVKDPQSRFPQSRSETTSPTSTALIGMAAGGVASATRWAAC